jgi:EAL domain-containing protein (putative c-di-GMP-specific phosphodiesterase class I)/PAS domain-containing protein
MDKGFPQLLLDGIPDAVMVVDAAGMGLFANQAAKNLFGFDIVGQQVGVPLEDFAVVQVPHEGLMREVELRVADASEWSAGSRAVVLRDVTERERLKAGLQDNVQKLKSFADLLEVVPAPVARTDSAGKIEWANQAFKKSFGEVKTLLDVPALATARDKVAKLFAPVSEPTSTEDSAANAVTEQVFEAGISEHIPLVVQAVALDGAKNPKFAVVLNTTLERQELMETYLKSVFMDADLGIPNRRGLVMQGESDWSDATFEQAVMVVLSPGGDSVEQELVVLRLVDLIKNQWEEVRQGASSSEDSAAKLILRIGRVLGDSIGCILSAPRDSETGAASLADTLANKVIEHGLDRLHIGLVADTRASTSLDLALEEATIAAQEASSLGKRLHSFTDDYGQVMKTRRDLAEAVRAAIINKSFTIVFQPRIDVVSKKIVAAEVLARLHHETLGDIAPDQFIPILQRFNLISELTQLVGQKALEQMQSWKEKGLKPVTLSINISPGDISSSRALSVLRSLAREFAEGSALELEMSEMDPFPLDSHEALKALLKNLGIELSLDDFGKGYSSFSYLVSLPISVIKVDKSFADDLLDVDKKAASVALYRSIVALARELKILICAEGVETQEQVDELALLGVDQIQGYIFSKPLTSADFEAGYLK